MYNNSFILHHQWKYYNFKKLDRKREQTNGHGMYVIFCAAIGQLRSTSAYIPWLERGASHFLA